jgi:hypothetical protein
MERPCEFVEFVEAVGCEWAFVEELSDDHIEWWCDCPRDECPALGELDSGLGVGSDHRPPPKTGPR